MTALQPRAGERVERRVRAPSSTGRAPRRAGDCRRRRRRRPRCASAPRPGSAWNARPRAAKSTAAQRALDDGPADRMLRPRFERRRQLRSTSDGCRAVERQRRRRRAVRPFVSVPVLSNATQRDGGQPLEPRAALDEHALARRGGQRRHDRHRRRDDERARARDDQQHERAVDPGAPLRRRGRAAAARRRPAPATSTTGV